MQLRLPVWHLILALFGLDCGISAKPSQAARLSQTTNRFMIWHQKGHMIAVPVPLAPQIPRQPMDQGPAKPSLRQRITIQTGQIRKILITRFQNLTWYRLPGIRNRHQYPFCSETTSQRDPAIGVLRISVLGDIVQHLGQNKFYPADQIRPRFTARHPSAHISQDSPDGKVAGSESQMKIVPAAGL